MHVMCSQNLSLSRSGFFGTLKMQQSHSIPATFFTTTPLLMLVVVMVVNCCHFQSLLVLCSPETKLRGISKLSYYEEGKGGYLSR